MRSADAGSTRELPLFHDMAEAHFGQLMSAALLQKFPPHTTLIREGELPDFLHVLVEGAVELFASWEERETTIDIIGPVTTFILAAVIRDEVYLKSARTLTPARILMIPAQAVRDVFGCDAHFARAIVNELAERYRRVVRVLKDRKLRTGVERLANWILEQDQAQGNQGCVTLGYDKRKLSARLGMTPENLSRNMTSLKNHGIAARGRNIVITDRKALQDLARPSALIDGAS